MLGDINDRRKGGYGMRRMTGFMAVAALGLALTAAEAKSRTPNATLRLTGGSVAAGVGVDWGRGTLTYQGKTYPVAVKGLSVGDVGVTSIEASGKVFNLKRLSDFDGNYTAVDAGLTAGGGAGVAAMKNQNGVTVELASTSRGVEVALGGAGVDMRIRK
jgi:outer membrane immunogenic protein